MGMGWVRFITQRIENPTFKVLQFIEAFIGYIHNVSGIGHRADAKTQ